MNSVRALGDLDGAPGAPDAAPGKSDVAPDGLTEGRLQRALSAAYGYLNKRERTTAEVAGRLRRDGYSTGTIEEALAALQESGTLDDYRFVRLFIEDKRELEQWGNDRIRRALVQRGVDPETVDALLARTAGSAEAWLEERERALALLRRRFPEPPRTRRDRDRALGALLRKGYDPDLAVETLCVYARE